MRRLTLRCRPIAKPCTAPSLEQHWKAILGLLTSRRGASPGVPSLPSRNFE